MNKLKRLRSERGWSMRKLSENSGVEIATISNLENGKSTAYSQTIVALERALDLEPDTLNEFLYTPNPKISPAGRITGAGPDNRLLGRN